LDSFALLLASGYPIGEPRRNNRYRDNNADQYDDVESKSSDAQFRLSARGRCVKRELGTTIGHMVYDSMIRAALSNAGAV
jgi:hypothetical protein